MPFDLLNGPAGNLPCAAIHRGFNIAEIGYSPEFAEPVLDDWNNAIKSQGELRKMLEKEIWPRCVVGAMR